MPRIWRVFYDEDKNCIEALSDTVGLVRFQQDRGRWFVRAEELADGTPRGCPATVAATLEERLLLTRTSTTQFYEHVESNKSFLDLLKSWGGEWM